MCVDRAGCSVRRGSVRFVQRRLYRTVLAVMGMRDNACRERLADALTGLEGVEDVDVSLHQARAVIVYREPCVLEALLGAVVRAGFGAALGEPASASPRENGRGGGSSSGSGRNERPRASRGP